MSDGLKDEQKTRIVNSMCMTWRHDFGLDKRDDHFGSCGMTDDERETLRAQMGQLFDHHIAPEIAKSERLQQQVATLYERLQAQAASSLHLKDHIAVELADWTSQLLEENDPLRAERDQLQAKVETLQKEAELYRQLRNLPEEMLGAPGVPCVAVPDGPKSGRYVSGADLDAVMGAAQ